jgi:2'-5' RNA ligase
MHRHVMRAFIAIDFDEPIRRQLADLQGTLRRRAGKLSWVAAGKLHLTIKFLGEIEPAQAAAVSTTIDALAADIAPFQVVLRGVGVFPPRGLARTLWVGIEAAAARDHAADPLGALQRACEDRLAAIGFAREGRPFHPHLTLARNKLRFDRDLRRSLEHAAGFFAGPQRIEAVTFYESTLGRAGSMYRAISRHVLTGTS